MSNQITTVEPNGFSFGEIHVSRNSCGNGEYWVGVRYRGVSYSIGPSELGHFCLSDYAGQNYYRLDQIKAVRSMLKNRFTVPQISSELCISEHCVRELKKLINELATDT